MRIILLLATLLMYVSTANGQDQKIYKQSLVGQIHGGGLVGYPISSGSVGYNFIGLDARYDRVFQTRDNLYLGFAVETSLNTYWGLSLGPDFVLLAGKRKHFFEFNVGHRFVGPFSGTFHSPNLNLAYRFEAEKNPFMLRVGTGYTNWLFISLGGQLKSGPIKSRSERKAHPIGLSVGTNLFTPLEYYFNQVGKYNAARWFVAQNQCIVLNPEISKGKWGLNVPIRLPLGKLKTDSPILKDNDFVFNPKAQDWESDAYNDPYLKRGAGTFSCLFELGLKPRYYFKPKSEKVRGFTELGIYYGRFAQIGERLHQVYQLDTTSNVYSVPDRALWTGELIEGPAGNHLRVSIGTGFNVQLSDRLSLGFEFEITWINRNWISIIVTNEGSLDGDFHEIDTEATRDGPGVQLGLNLNYHIFK